jgi:hypothetical protein
MNILTAENAIITRLQDQIKSTLTSDFDAPLIQSFPKDPNIHFESINPQGEILVRFDSSNPDLPIANRESVIVQDMPINWGVWIVTNNLVEHTGAYEWISAVKDALTGWAVSDWADSTPLYCTNIQLIEESGGIWFYEMMFQHFLEESET